MEDKKINSSIYNTIIESDLYTNMCVPSTVHAYSLGIEYIRKWLLSKFEPNFFKTVYVNGQHLFSDFKRFNREQLNKRDKPMIAIVPNIDTDYDRDNLDTYLTSKNTLVKRHYSSLFISDSDLNIYLGLGMEQMQINFGFRIRVETKSQQLDLWKYVQMAYKIGATQSEYIDIDFHIPNSIIYGIAELAHFDIVYDEEGIPIRVKDIYSFLSYLNSKSVLPIVYKLRAVNGNSEFFIRMNRCYMHISTLDKVQLDDGEQAGQSSTNYHIDFSCILRMPVPKFYYLESRKKIKSYIPMKEVSNIGIYNLKHTDVPDKNNKGWDKYLDTEYAIDEYPESYPYTIPVSELFNHENINTIIDDAVKSGISPGLFIDVVVYNNGYPIPIVMDWTEMDIVINNGFFNLMFYIVIYVDLEYINKSLINVKNINDGRLQ